MACQMEGLIMLYIMNTLMLPFWQAKIIHQNPIQKGCLLVLIRYTLTQRGAFNIIQ